MSNRTGFGWENFNSQPLKHGMILMIDEVDIAYVVENTFSGKDVTEYKYTNLEFPIGTDGTYYDNNGDVLRKITAVSDSGWMNEPQIKREIE